MKIRFIAIAAAAVVACSPIAFAQNQGNSNAPGQQMLQKGPAPGSPGASGYAPGHLKKKHVVRRSTHRHLTRTSAHRHPAAMVQKIPSRKAVPASRRRPGWRPRRPRQSRKILTSSNGSFCAGKAASKKGRSFSCAAAKNTHKFAVGHDFPDFINHEKPRISVSIFYLVSG